MWKSARMCVLPCHIFKNLAGRTALGTFVAFLLDLFGFTYRGSGLKLVSWWEIQDEEWMQEYFMVAEDGKEAGDAWAGIDHNPFASVFVLLYHNSILLWQGTGSCWRIWHELSPSHNSRCSWSCCNVYLTCHEESYVEFELLKRTQLRTDSYILPKCKIHLRNKLRHVNGHQALPRWLPNGW